MGQQKNKTEAWDRIHTVIQISGMSINGFAKHIGLARGENLYQIKRGNNRISFEMAECVCNRFPWVNKLWLLIGEGEMCIGAPNTAGSIFAPFRGTRRDWFAGIALAGLLAAGRFNNTHECANNIADEMETLLTSEAESRENHFGDITDNPATGSYYWYLGMAMFGLLAGRCESTTCQHIKKFADDMYTLNS